jgi:hypothetical protein
MEELTSHLIFHKLIEGHRTNALGELAGGLTEGIRFDNTDSVADTVCEQLFDELEVVADESIMISAVNVMVDNTLADLEFSDFEVDPEAHPDIFGYDAGLGLLRQYATLLSVHTGALESLDLECLITTNAGDQAKQLGKSVFRLHPIKVEGGRHTGLAEGAPDDVELYLDAPAGYVLTRDEQPVGFASYELDINGSFYFAQLQGVRGTLRAQPPRWASTLVQIGEHIAKGNSITRSVVQSAANNAWLNDATIVKRYDRTAQNLGYSQGSDGNWRKDIS